MILAPLAARLRRMSRRERVLAVIAVLFVVVFFWPRLKSEYYYVRVVTGNGEQQVVYGQRLEWLGHPAAISPLRRMLHSHDSFRRWQAAQALAKYRGEEVKRLLIDAATSDPDPKVRIAAVEGLGELHDPTLVPVLVDLGQRDEWLRDPAVNSLWDLGPEAREAAERLKTTVR